MNKQLMFSSNDQTWETPKDFFSRLDREFKFTLDPCATPETAKVSKYFTQEIDGLTQSWSGERVFMNPPYGREISKWIQKAAEESQKEDTIVVGLIPARTDTRYWHRYIFPVASEIRFIKGRLKFGGSKNSAPFPSAVVVWKEGSQSLKVSIMES